MSSSTTTQAPPEAEASGVAGTPRPNTRTFALIGGMLVILTIAVAFFLVNRSPAHAFHGGVYDPAQPTPPLDLTDQNGNSFSLANEQGKVVLGVHP